MASLEPSLLAEASTSAPAGGSSSLPMPGAPAASGSGPMAVDGATSPPESLAEPASKQRFWSSLSVEDPSFDPSRPADAPSGKARAVPTTPDRPRPAGKMTGAAIRAAAKPAPDLPGPHRHPGREVRPRAPPLNLDTVATSSTPVHILERSGKSRLFGLEHCPVYRPTLEEFSQPLVYIEQVARESEDCGIAKIIPPDGWKPDFALDTELFRFRTRLQRLNSMEAASRASVNFLEQLHAFHSTRGSARASIPIIEGKPVNLFALRREVDRLGGFDVISSSRRWGNVARALGYSFRSGPGVTTQVKSAYTKIIQPFEQMRSGVPTNGATKSPFAAITPNRGSPGAAAANGSPVTIGRVREAAAKLNAALRMDPNDSTAELPPLMARTTTQDEEVCQICYTMERESPLLLCEDCDRAYHMSCLTPALTRVPEDDWFCDECIIATGDDFGFEEGPEHSVDSYQRRADTFRQRWLDAHPPKPLKSANSPSPALNGHASAAPKPALLKSEPAYTFLPPTTGRTTAKKIEVDAVTKRVKSESAPEVKLEAEVTPPPTAAAAAASPVPSGETSWEERLHIEDHLEREFWRVVESQTETVEVEYGADLHVKQYGSGFPTLEQHPNNAYSRDGWNLNNLPVAPGSVLRYVASDISGMTSPWIYFGMLFSAFAWHKEDHHTYSINYQHLGATKTWYGVPGAEEQHLEAAMRDAAPELFEQTPDLMYQLTTLMSPGRIKRTGVPVYACDQRPNEIVVTFPGAYHTGFNHGLNVNEAVNFALPDWIVHGLTAVVRYRGLAKAPVFSHDQLLVSIYTHDKSPRTSRWLLMSFREMCDREANDRARVRARADVTQVLHEVEPGEEDAQCSRCRAFAYLSHLIRADHPESTPEAPAPPPQIVCAIHVDDLGPGPKLLRIRFTDSDLTAMANRVQSRASKAGARTSASLLPPPPVVEIIPDDPDAPRASKRKRKPTAALLAALADDDEPDPRRRKLSHGGDVPPGIDPRIHLMVSGDYDEGDQGDDFAEP